MSRATLDLGNLDAISRDIDFHYALSDRVIPLRVLPYLDTVLSDRVLPTYMTNDEYPAQAVSYSAYPISPISYGSWRMNKRQF